MDTTRVFYFQPGGQWTPMSEESATGFHAGAMLDLWGAESALWLTVHERAHPEALADFEVQSHSPTGYFSLLCADYPALLCCLGELLPRLHAVNLASDATDLAWHRKRHRQGHEPGCPYCVEREERERLQ